VPDVPVAMPENALPAVPDEVKDMTFRQLQAAEDDQLLRAVKLLADQGLRNTYGVLKRGIE